MQNALLATHPLEFLRNVINSEGIKNIVDILRVNYFWCMAENIPNRWLTAFTCMWMSSSPAPARTPSACQTTIKQRNINHFFVIYSMYPSSNPFEPIAGYALLSFFSLYLFARVHSVAAPASSIPHEIRHVFEFRFYFSSKIYLFIYDWIQAICLSTNTEATQNVFNFYCLPVCLLVGGVLRTAPPPPTVAHSWWVWARSCQPNRSVGLYKTARIYKWLPKCFRTPPFVVCRLFNVRKWTEQNKYA